jgi:hypothetical protein
MGYGDIDLVADYGADPTWATYSDTAFAEAIAAASPGQTIGVPPGLYKVRAPIVIKPYVGLAGGPGTPLVASWAEYGSVIKPGPDWSQGEAPLNAVLLLLGPAAGGYSTASEEQHLTHLLLSGSALPPGPSVHGLASLDDVKRVQLREVHIARMTGDGIRQEHPHAQPGGWTAFHVFSRYNAGSGYLLRSADSSWTKCLATNSGADGWNLDTTGNSQYNGCRSEWSGGQGYRYECNNDGTASGGVSFTGCHTDRSAQNGFLAAGGSGVPLLLTGCSFKRDGAAGGTTYAGLALSGYPGPAVAAGCVVFPGVNDDGSGIPSPHNGLSIGGTERALLSGCYIQGHSRAWTVDSSPLVHTACAWAEGPTNARVIVAGP